MSRVAYVTADPGRDDEIDVARQALADQGLAMDVVRWDDPAADWSAYDLAVVRSTWDYTGRREEFLDWAHKAGAATLLRNPVTVLKRNTDKTYLRDLAARDVPVVPTVWYEPGTAVDAVDAPWAELVVKPAVSAGARDTIRTADRDAALAQVRRILASGRTAMVQPYLASVEGEGETTLLFYDGEFSHAVRKGPMLVPRAGEDARWQVTPREPAGDQLALAEYVLSLVPEREDLLYARVDLVRADDGRPLLIELELTEPYLFLRYAEHAPARFAAAVARLLRR